MRRYLLTIAIVLAVHAATAFVSRTYLGWLLDLGALFVHNTDIASIFDRELAGFSLAAGALVAGAILMTYLRRPRRAASGATKAADSYANRQINIDPSNELQRPEFWALHYSEIVGIEYRGSSVMMEAVFGFPYARLHEYFTAIYKPEGEEYLITVPTVVGYDVGVQVVDCGESGAETRYSIGHGKWPEREYLGYNSPHFALPAFRWTEIAQIARAIEPQSPDNAARAMLLLFPATYLTNTDDPDLVEESLLRSWRQIKLPDNGRAKALIRSAVENQRDSELEWRDDSDLGWINNGEYSFRNPSTGMASFDPRRFARVRAFLASCEPVRG